MLFTSSENKENTKHMEKRRFRTYYGPKSKNPIAFLLEQAKVSRETDPQTYTARR